MLECRTQPGAVTDRQTRAGWIDISPQVPQSFYRSLNLLASERAPVITCLITELIHYPVVDQHRGKGELVDRYAGGLWEVPGFGVT